MSAYVVEKKTIDRIVTYLKDANKTQDPNDLGQRLWDLNAKSVATRYSEEEEKKEYKYNWMPTRKIQVLKSMACFLYQSCEGGLHEEELYKFIDRERSALAVTIVYDTQEYEESEWG